jgi:23S rRNA (guanine745-N1)-methyltransferase
MRPRKEPVLVSLVCPVRSCGLPLAWGERRVSCTRGHVFDVARSGYCNLLQPQDRRAKAPGDSREVVLARRRMLDRGLADALLQVLGARLEGLRLPPAAPVVDIGCGEGFFLRGIARRVAVDPWGVDISTAAIDAAARRGPGCRWIVANADRRLPFAAGSFAALLSIASRRNPAEFRRLLRPDGRAVVVVPAPDDLAELRAAALGRAVAKDRSGPAVAALAPCFELEGREEVRSVARLDGDGLRDLLAGTYRGGRRGRLERLAGMPALDVTSSHVVLCFRPRPDAAAAQGR